MRDRTDSLIRVLIAEDEEPLRSAIADLIASEGDLEVAAAVGTAEEAVASAAERRPDVALVDVRMPGGGGPWATREIRRLSPGTQVIAFSGSSDPTTVDAMREAGASGYLVKGSSLTTILQAIEEAAARCSHLGAP